MGLDNRVATLVAIDDDTNFLELIRAALTQDELEVVTFADAQEGLGFCLRRHPQIVVTDLNMPKLNGLEVLRRIVEADPAIEVILLTGNYSTESAVSAIQQGAADYLEKPLPVEKLRRRVYQAIESFRRRQEAAKLDQQLLQTFSFESMIGRSPEMLAVYSLLQRVAPHYRVTLVTGETGTGKELVARALHQLSPVASGPFAVCNCSAIVETLFESELFGHVKGSFTGASQDRIGLFEYANGGTLLLDEIGDMPLVTQAKLLRVLQYQEIQRVGSPAPRKVDVRVVAATNRDLLAMVKKGEFREDLYYRLSMVRIQLPALRERREDLPLLVRHFVERFSAQYNKPIRGLTRRAQALISRYPWPGNVRELENAIGHACMMAQGDFLDVGDLPTELHRPAESLAAGEDEMLTLDELSRRHARRVLERTGGNKLQAAGILGISRSTLYRLLGEKEAEEVKHCK
ncbi:MAG TPA: sigma-54 dependent transcriptional regulator [Candidatus Xenobia bacterium]|nr:sigma-54 dependent transcriptional regulator [Candidatus Xenobia bacterium]